MIIVRANARNATYISDDLITSGSVGIPVTFNLSEDFDGLSCIAVFEGSGVSIDVALMGDSCVVPHEVLATAGGYLRIGIYAANSEGTIVIPTVWAGSKMILRGTTPSEVDPSEPTPSWVAQVQEAAAEALENSEEAIEIAGGAEAAAADARQSASAAATSATAAGQYASAAGTAQAAAEAAQAAAVSARDAAVAAQGSAESSAQAAAGSATAAANSATAAAASEAAAREVEESIPADYTALSEDVSELKSQINEMLPVETRTPTLTITSKKTWTNDNGTATLVDNTTANFRASNAVAVEADEEVTMTFVSTKHTGYSDVAVFVVDEDYGILASYDAPASGIKETTYQFTIPENGAFFMINQWASSQPTNFVIKQYKKAASEEDVTTNSEKIAAIEADSAEGKVKLYTSVSKTQNLLNYENIKEGSIDVTTGVFTPVITPVTYKYMCTDFIPVEPNTQYFVNFTSLYGYYFYDNNMDYVSGWTGGSGNYSKEYTVPENGRFVRLYMYLRNNTGSDGTPAGYVKEHWSMYEYGYDTTDVQYSPTKKIHPSLETELFPNADQLRGKTFAVIGDSIGTRQGFNTPEILIGADDVGIELSAYLSYNDVQAGLTIGDHTYTSNEIGTEVTFIPTQSDVGKEIGRPANHGGANDVRWWQLLEQKLGMSAVNASWSGASMVSYESRVENGQYDCSCAWYVPTIRRCGFRTAGSMDRISPDYIFIDRGVNDISTSHAGNVTVLTDDTFDAYNYVIPETDAVTIDGQTKYDFKQAYAMTIQKLRNAYPAAKIICCTITPFRRNNETHYPPNNGKYSLPQFNAAIREVAAYFACPVCEMAEAFSFEQRSVYTADGTHPNQYGHRAMYFKALDCLVRNFQPVR